MTKIWALLVSDNTDYGTTSFPCVIADSLEAIKTYLKKDPCYDHLPIVYAEFDGAFECGSMDAYDLGWKYWEGTKEASYTWKNITTGEFDPRFEDRDDITDDEYANWVDGFIYEVYRDGKLVDKYFE